MTVNRAPQLLLILQSETETQDPGQFGCHIAKQLSLGNETQRQALTGVTSGFF